MGLLYTSVSKLGRLGQSQTDEINEPRGHGVFMSQKSRPSADDKSAPVDGSGKKLYRKPEFRYERAFETMALSCGKTNPNLRQCSLNRKVS